MDFISYFGPFALGMLVGAAAFSQNLPKSQVEKDIEIIKTVLILKDIAKKEIFQEGK